MSEEDTTSRAGGFAINLRPIANEGAPGFGLRPFTAEPEQRAGAGALDELALYILRSMATMSPQQLDEESGALPVSSPSPSGFSKRITAGAVKDSTLFFRS